MTRKFEACSFTVLTIGWTPKFKNITWRWLWPFQQWFVIVRLRFAVLNRLTKSEVSNSSWYEDRKGDGKCRKLGGLGS